MWTHTPQTLHPLHSMEWTVPDLLLVLLVLNTKRTLNHCISTTAMAMQMRGSWIPWYWLFSYWTKQTAYSVGGERLLLSLIKNQFIQASIDLFVQVNTHIWLLMMHKRRWSSRQGQSSACYQWWLNEQHFPIINVESCVNLYIWGNVTHLSCTLDHPSPPGLCLCPC